MPAISHNSILFACQEAVVRQLIVDTPSTVIPPAAPSAPGTPVITTSITGAASYSYTAYLSNGYDSVASTAGTIATGPALVSIASYNTITLAAPVPAGQCAIVVRTVAPGSQATNVVIGKIGPAGTFCIDNGSTGTVTYVANSTGILYGPGIKCPGIQMVGHQLQLKKVALRGDFQLIDSEGIPEDSIITYKMGKLALDAVAIMYGGATVDAGATPSRVATFSHLGSSRPNYFSLEARSVRADIVGGDVHVFFAKCMADTAFKAGLNFDAFQEADGGATAIPRMADNVDWQYVLNETAVPLTYGV